MSTRRPVPLRHSMALMHTWAGVVLGGVLFAVFWMGTLSVFDREIDRWMMPETRLGPAPAVSFDAVARHLERLAPAAPQWSVTLPSDRTPTTTVRHPGPEGSVLRHLDPVTAAPLAPAATLGGTGFIFPFHFSLHLGWRDFGIWLVGLCGMAMLVLVVSGVIIHLRLLRDFFMFRPSKALTRSTLDLHTAMGVMAMPFHFIMPLSGLIIFFSIFFPGTWQAAFDGDREAFNREVFGSYQRPPANAPATLASLDAMVAEAERRWSGRRAHFARVVNPGDAASVVEIRRSPKDDVSMNRDAVYFDGVSGAVLARFESKPVGALQRYIAGIHFVQFDNWLLRWLYFAGGLAGCVMIATGFLFWIESRRAEHERRGLRGVRLVELLAIGSVTGIILATLAFFIANRCLPASAAWLGLGRAQLELLVFYVVWLLTFAHAAWRGRAAWAEQSASIAAAAVLAAPLNWLTTGDHPLRAVQRGASVVAGMDALLWCLAALALVAARRLSRVPVARQPRERLPLARGLDQAGAGVESEVAHG